MSGPSWLAAPFAIVMAAVAVYSAGRLVVARRRAERTHTDVDVAHVAMGVAMAGMLERSLNVVPSGVWEVVFVALALWFVGRCSSFARRHGVTGRDEDHVHHLSHYLTHLVMSLAMLYMYLAPVPGRSGTGAPVMTMGGATGTRADFVGLPLLFLVVLFASGIWELDGIGRFSSADPPRRPPPGGRPEAPPLGAPGAAPGDPPLAVEALPASAAVTDCWLAPRSEAACHIAMCITMGYMLILLL